MRIVFFGTPEFAGPSLQALIDDGNELVGVVTQPDRPRGRSRSTLAPSPVKLAALENAVPVLQPERPVGDVFLAALRHLEPELGVVVAYGHILKPVVLEVPRYGMINLHASLLPELRGAAPIPWSILRGDARTGVTVMQMEAGLDSGPILHHVATEIAPDETGGSLSKRLAELGADALVDALALIRLGAVSPVPQDQSRASHAPKVGRALAQVRWDEDAHAVARRIRAFDPVPGAWSTFGGSEIKLFRPRVVPGAGEPGMVVAMRPSLQIAAGSGAVEIEELQPAGRTRMAAAQWARGRIVVEGDHFG